MTKLPQNLNCQKNRVRKIFKKNSRPVARPWNRSPAWEPQTEVTNRHIMQHRPTALEPLHTQKPPLFSPTLHLTCYNTPVDMDDKGERLHRSTQTNGIWYVNVTRPGSEVQGGLEEGNGCKDEGGCHPEAAFLSSLSKLVFPVYDVLKFESGFRQQADLNSLGSLTEEFELFRSLM